jgi:hypothetical protein
MAELLVPVTEDDWKSANFLQRHGQICAEHCWLVDVYNQTDMRKAADAFVERFGMLGTQDGFDTGLLDYAVYRALGLTVDQAARIHERAHIWLVLHALKDKVWSDPSKGWASAIAVNKPGRPEGLPKWVLIPIA